MTGEAKPLRVAFAKSGTIRAVGFFILWIALSNGVLADILPGVVAALAAAAVSLPLVPPTGSRIRALPLAELVVRFLGASVIAGADVARRALDPRLPIDPGLLRYQVGLPRGALRNAFTTLASLLPGTVPIGSDECDQLVVHCLDRRQPIAEQLAAEEAQLLRVVGRASDNG
jgi:multicomponent Na+:H+ antiporter subunit E